MKKAVLKLENNYTADIKLLLEPEAIIHEFRKGESIDIEISPSVGISVSLMINEYEGDPGFYLQIWQNQGDYKVLSED